MPRFQKNLPPPFPRYKNGQHCMKRLM